MAEHTKTYYDWKMIQKIMNPNKVDHNKMAKTLGNQKLMIERESNHKNKSYLIQVYSGKYHLISDQQVIKSATGVMYYVTGWLVGREEVI